MVDIPNGSVQCITKNQTYSRVAGHVGKHITGMYSSIMGNIPTLCQKEHVHSPHRHVQHQEGRSQKFLKHSVFTGSLTGTYSIRMGSQMVASDGSGKPAIDAAVLPERRIGDTASATLSAMARPRKARMLTPSSCDGQPLYRG